jgi:Raf kinase inhibitor-like YbhB/YbcL family protein
MLSRVLTNRMACHRQSLARLGIVVMALLGASGCRNEQVAPPSTKSPVPEPSASSVGRAESSRGDKVMKINLTSGAFKNGAAIPAKYTSEGNDVSPPLAWDSAPKETQEFALICDDPDAPSAQPWVHWVIYGIAADVRALPEGVKSNAPQLTAPIAAKQGKNSWDSGVTTGYRGPQPPPGHGTHHYHFKLYALDKRLDLPPEATKQQVLDAMKGHVLTEGELMGTYER